MAVSPFPPPTELKYAFNLSHNLRISWKEAEATAEELEELSYNIYDEYGDTMPLLVGHTRATSWYYYGAKYQKGMHRITVRTVDGNSDESLPSDPLNVVIS